MFGKKLFTLAILSISLQLAYTQVETPVKWKYNQEKTKEGLYKVVFTATIDQGWHMYGLNIEDGGPIPTSFNFEKSDNLELLGDIETDHQPKVKFDNTFEMEVELFNNQVSFIQKVKATDASRLKGYVEFMACDDSKCLPPDEFEFDIALGGLAVNTKSSEKIEKSDDTKDVFKQSVIANIDSKLDDDVKEQKDTTKTKQQGAIITDEKEDLTSLWILFFQALLGGLAAIITPCVYPIIPLTVSFFSRESKSRLNTIFKALSFGISIIAIYTSLGLISGIFKIDLMNEITSRWLPNLIFFLLFLIFAASFFGAFEIMLPNSWANKIDQQADKGGVLGSFFMALATAVVSFSCTGPIAGFILGSALRGDVITPVIGMFGFGLGFALPFTLLALFPSALKSMPKSGGWLNSVKVVFAFIMLLFSLIFLGLLGRNFIPRDFILALAVVILVLLGLYLIGKLKFSHDSELKYISVPRILLTIVAWSFAAYLATGIFGAPLKKISPFLPAKYTLSLDLTKTLSATKVSPAENICSEDRTYADKLHFEYGLKGYFVWDEALACAKELDKPVLVDFAGHSCKNCKKMYAEVWSDPEVQKMLREDFVLLALYTDDRSILPEDEWITSKLDGRVKKTIGKKNLDFQVTRYNSNALPMYVIVDPEGNILTESKNFYTYSNDISAFIAFLKEGLENYK